MDSLPESELMRLTHEAFYVGCFRCGA